MSELGSCLRQIVDRGRAVMNANNESTSPVESSPFSSESSNSSDGPASAASSDCSTVSIIFACDRAGSKSQAPKSHEMKANEETSKTQQRKPVPLQLSRRPASSQACEPDSPSLQVASAGRASHRHSFQSSHLFSSGPVAGQRRYSHRSRAHVTGTELANVGPTSSSGQQSFPARRLAGSHPLRLQLVATSW